MTETLEWQLSPDLDTYYAVVATDARVARKIANHMDQLPVRCTDSLRAGLEDEQLREWLEELAAVTATHARHVDWRAVEVRNVL
jgi:hypothetical protein